MHENQGYELKGFSIIEKIYESNLSVIYRGFKKKGNNVPVIIKYYKPDNLTKRELENINSEYRLLNQLKNPGIIMPDSLESIDNNIFLIMEDFGGISLYSYMKMHKLSIKEFLEIALKITDILAYIHDSNIIHKNIEPRNILIHEKTGHTKIIDFSLASQVRREKRNIVSADKIEGSLAYISPEQTGRMNRSIDYRTDFYSLGVTFYEMLTGRLPFEYTDPLELVHAHIARLPARPSEINPEIPDVLSDIIMKLMSKNPEERYQSGKGLRYDLNKSLDLLNKSKSVKSFNLGRMDITGVFQIPEKLYGREKEIQLLFDKYEAASRAGATPDIIIFSGFPGIGKSSLINEIQKRLAVKNSYFIQGKYDQFRRSMPYSAIIGAFSDLASQILSENEEKLHDWRKKIIDAVGDNGSIITEVIPRFKLIIGEQPKAPELGPAETENRFSYVFENFTRIIASQEHPLVMFLDDLQWADRAGLKWLSMILNDNQLKNFLFIGAYRDNEITESHPFMLFLNELKKANIHWDDIRLDPLTAEDIEKLLSETLQIAIDGVHELAGTVMVKTGGNPFFVNEFVKSLYENSLISFKDGWNFDINQIKEAHITDNVVEFMAQKVSKLPGKTQEILKIASCIGIGFHLDILSKVYGVDENDIIEALKPVISEGMIIKQEDSFNFVHDKVREAVYGLSSELEKEKCHYEIGKILIKTTPPEKIDERVFTIVHQLNYAVKAIIDQTERISLAELNLKAGIMAKSSTAYEAAKLFLNTGINLLPENSWKELYKLTLSLYTEAGETEYLNGNHENAEELFNEVLNNAKDIQDKVRVYSIQLPFYTTLYQYNLALDKGLKALALLGVNMPKRANPLVLIKELLIAYVLVAKLTGKKGIDSLLDLPAASDSKIIAASNLMMQLSTSVYLNYTEYVPIIALKLFNYSLKYGISVSSAFAFILYAVILCGFFGKYDAGFQFGELALKLTQKFEINSVRCKVYFIFAFFINHCKNPMRLGINYFKEGFKIGMETGEMLFTAYCIVNDVVISFFSGEPIEAVKNTCKLYQTAIKKLNQKDAIVDFNMFYQLLINLSSFREDKFSLSGSEFNEQKAIADWKKNHDLGDYFNWLSNKTVVHCLYNDYENSVRYAQKAKKYIKILRGAPHQKKFYFYYTLSLIGCYKTVNKKKQRQYLKIIKVNAEKIKKWAANCPQDNLHEILIIKAELFVIQNHLKEAMELFDRAAEEAGKNGYINEKAMIFERASLFYRSTGSDKIADMYIKNAYTAYQDWGAVRKLEDLRQIYGDIFPKTAQVDSQFNIDTSSAAASTFDDSSSSEIIKGSASLDLNTVFKSAAAISGEIVMDKLIGRLIDIVMENAGAQKAVLVLKKDEDLVIEAIGLAGKSEPDKIKSKPLENSDSAPETLIRYVARTGENIVLNNAFLEGPFTKDNYIKENRVRSALCSPFVSKGNIIGVIYLENNLSDGVFTKERFQTIKILSSQIGISIDNALLYEKLEGYTRNLESMVHERTQKLEKANEEIEEVNVKLKNLDTLKNDFIANITHDFRSPLTVILNTSELAIKYDKAINNGTRKNFEVVYNASLRLNSSIDKLLELARMDAQGVRLKVKKVELTAFLSSILDFYSSSVMSSGIKIVRRLPDKEVDDFYTDSEKLGEILDNILSNAVKFVDPQTGIITAELNDKKDSVEIIISDNGIGIPGDKLEIIFNRFEQAHGERRGTYRGTGIGLAFAKQLTEYLKGSIRAESGGPEKGSRFILELKKGRSIFNENDFSEEEYKEEKKTSLRTLLESDLGEKVNEDKIQVYLTDLNKENESDYRKGILLIIDDDKNIKKILVKYLQNHDYKNFILASDGKQGLEAVYEYSPDIIICDYNMPVMKGDELHNQLINNPKFRGIPFIFLSAVADENIIVERREKGARAYLKKPIDEKMLSITVEEHLKKYFEYLKVFQMAKIDELTGLNNRRSVMESLKHELAIRTYRDLSLIFFDIDNFKTINDKYGHPAGDKLLSALGTIMKTAPRNYDIVGRYGGDEFIMILPDTNLKNALHAAENIRKAIAGLKTEYQAEELSMSASFGAASLKDNAGYIAKELNIASLEELYEIKGTGNVDWDKIEKEKARIADILIKMADEALYRAKKTICRKCGFSSEKADDFKNKKCPQCRNKDLNAGRNKVVGFY